MNAVFRVYKYPVDYAAFTGKTLKPGDFVDKYTTEANDDPSQFPASFALSQNYPNPFNPTTVIQYQLAAKGPVDLRVYDILGREVAVLVKGEQGPGRFSVSFNARGVSSGVYFYRFTAGKFMDSKKMVVAK